MRVFVDVKIIKNEKVIKLQCEIKKKNTKKNTILLSSGNKVLAVVRAGETYETLKESLQKIRESVGELVTRQELERSDGELVEVETFLGGDYKVNIFKHTFFSR